MKKAGIAVLLSVLLCGALAVYLRIRSGGEASQVSIVPVESGIYSEEDIQAAADTVIQYFQREFEGCTLTELRYAGDEAAGQFAEWAEQYQADEAIVLLSAFDVDASGGDGSLNPNSTYEGWQWILGRNAGGEWEHFTHGYG